MSNNDTMKVLNQLVEISEDGEQGFAEVAREATHPELKNFFQRRSDDCGTVVMELQALLQSLGAAPVDIHPVSASGHPGWAKQKATIEDANLTALKEVEDAEDQAEAAYAEALAAELPRQIRNVLQRQHNGVVRNQSHIHDLRISYKTAQPAWPEGQKLAPSVA